MTQSEQSAHGGPCCERSLSAEAASAEVMSWRSTARSASSCVFVFTPISVIAGVGSMCGGACAHSFQLLRHSCQALTSLRGR
jgi:hypothetical protein